MNEQQNLTIPIAIIVAGALIAGAVYFAIGKAPAPQNGGSKTEQVEIPPVSTSDYILGNPNAPIILVEYSDLECPFCKDFHQTLKNLMGKYGPSGQVAWVYRHFPIPQLHSKAPKEAEAAECAGKLGGNDAFWAYLDRVFEVTPSNNGLDLAKLPEIAKEIGLDETAFNQCLASGEFTAKVGQSYKDAVASGGEGTPYTVIISGSETYGITGAQSYAALEGFIENLLANPGSQAVPSI